MKTTSTKEKNFQDVSFNFCRPPFSFFFFFLHFFYQERCQYHSIYYTDDKVTNRFFRESHDNEI